MNQLSIMHLKMRFASIWLSINIRRLANYTIVHHFQEEGSLHIISSCFELFFYSTYKIKPNSKPNIDFYIL